MSVETARRVNGVIRAIALHHKARAGQLLEECGLHAGQEWVLQALQEQSPRTNAELAAWSGCEPPTVTNTVAKLETAGLLSRTRRAGDGRVIDVELTAAGCDLLSRIDQVWIALAEDTVGDLPPDEIAALAATLESVAGRLKRAREQHAAT